MEKKVHIGELRTILREDYGMESDQPSAYEVADTFKRFFSILDAIDRQTTNIGDKYEK